MNAQTTLPESFDQSLPLYLLPSGWKTGVVTGTDPDNKWDRRDSAAVNTHPLFTASHSGKSMLCYNGFKTSAGEKAYLFSMPFDLTNRTGPSNFRFWMHRDGEYAPPFVLVMGSVTAGSGTVALSNTGGIMIGMSAIGTGIGYNSVVTGIVGANSITLSTPATMTGQVAITFYAQGSEKLEVYINTAPTWTGATLLGDTAFGATTLYRYINCFPMAAGNAKGWNQYGFTIPAGPLWNVSKLYVILIATSDWDNDIYIDAFSIETWPKPMTYQNSFIEQNTVNAGNNTGNNWIIKSVIICDGAANPLTALNFTYNRIGTTANPRNAISANGAKLWFTGTTNSLDLITAQQVGIGTSACPTNFDFSGIVPLPNDTTYLWLTYDILSAAAGDCFDAEWVDVTINGGVGTQMPNPGTLPGCRMIDLPY